MNWWAFCCQINYSTVARFFNEFCSFCPERQQFGMCITKVPQNVFIGAGQRFCPPSMRNMEFETRLERRWRSRRSTLKIHLITQSAIPHNNYYIITNLIFCSSTSLLDVLNPRSVRVSRTIPLPNACDVSCHALGTIISFSSCTWLSSTWVSSILKKCPDEGVAAVKHPPGHFNRNVCICSLVKSLLVSYTRRG